MNINDVTFTPFKGSGPGGQHKNKTMSGCQATHEPTGITVRIDGRKYHQNKKKATKQLERKVRDEHLKAQQEDRNQERLKRLRDHRTVRTYNFVRQKARDHRSGKTARIEDMMDGLIPFHKFSTQGEYDD